MPAAIEDQQQQNNPHEPGDQYYDEFRHGWYQGYFFWFVVELSIPAGESGKALQSSDRVQSTVDRVDVPETQRLVQAAQNVNRAGETVTAYSRQQLSRAAVGTFSLTEEAASRLLGPGRSTGKQVDNAQTAARLDDQTVRIIADGSGDTAESFRRAVYRAADDDGVSYGQIDRAVRTIDDLDGPAKTRAERLVRETDGDGIRLVNELDDSTLRQFFEMENLNGYHGFDRWDDWRANLAKTPSKAMPRTLIDTLRIFVKLVRTMLYRVNKDSSKNWPLPTLSDLISEGSVVKQKQSTVTLASCPLWLSGQLANT